MGIFKLKKYKNGQLIEEVEDRNLIVTLGRVALAQLLATANSDDAISNIAVGDGTAAPALADTSLSNEFTKAIGGFSYPATGKVQFDWTIETGEAVGLTISEYALKTAAGNLFNRITRTGFAKTGDVRIVGAWIIDFTV